MIIGQWLDIPVRETRMDVSKQLRHLELVYFYFLNGQEQRIPELLQGDRKKSREQNNQLGICNNFLAYKEVSTPSIKPWIKVQDTRCYQQELVVVNYDVSDLLVR